MYFSYKQEGGYEVQSLTAMKSVYVKHTTLMIVILAGGSISVLAYMAHVAERDWQVNRANVLTGEC